MKTFSLVREQYLPSEVEDVFSFFSDAGNLELITPPWLRFKVLTPLTEGIQQGSVIDYRLRLRGIPMRWQSEITAWELPYRFVDEQRRGPFRAWVHEHRFDAVGSGARVIDEVKYAVAGDDFVNRLLVRPELDRIFDYRVQAMEAWARSR